VELAMDMRLKQLAEQWFLPMVTGITRLLGLEHLRLHQKLQALRCLLSLVVEAVETQLLLVITWLAVVELVVSSNFHYH
jgi:hypothetical protein